MSRSRTSRPTHDQNTVSRTVLSVVRILIASYFLATATGLIFEPASRTVFDAVLLKHHAQLVSTSYLFITAFAIMVGFVVRPAALLLAVYIFWSGFLHFDQMGTPEALAGFWRDMALLGAILLVAVTQPGGSHRFRLWAKPIAPRRIAQERLARAADRATRPPRSAEQLTRDAILSGHCLAFVSDAPMHESLDDGGAETDNIFQGVWDTPVATLPRELGTA